MKKLISVILFSSFLLTGCNYALDVDEQSYVIALGIDKGKEYRLRTTFVFSHPGKSGGGGEGESGGSSGEDTTDIVTLEAPTVFSAIRRLNAIKSKKINLTHTKIIVFSDELAKEGIKEYVSGFASARDFRPNTYICVSEGSTDEYLRAVKPIQDTLMENYFDHIMKKVAADKVNEAYLYYLYFNLTNKTSGSLVPLVGINENKLPENENNQTIESDDFGLNEIAGKLPRDSKNKAEIIGSAAFKNDKMIGTLGSLESELARLINNEFYPENYSFHFADTDSFVTIRITQNIKPSAKSTIKNGIAKIRIHVPISIKYIDPGTIATGSKQAKKFEKYVCSVLEEKTDSLIKKSQNEYNCDILGLSDLMKKHFIDNKEWEDFHWEDKYKSANVKVTYEIVSADYEETP